MFPADECTGLTQMRATTSLTIVLMGMCMMDSDVEVVGW